ncbi:hypothetical protein KBX31_05880 [Liquorilactobacillus satsumensis]|nr:hypothetical protein [Liquorilactobacillus satsumensis]MCP9312812.1 hypothetical protein [Liquorilactobacillus satsumensis]MCP9329216.1 hypothetical protein [Liquorilactobacillus satsumensis]MCP9359907.1 hypothetical protein [Liquorilactobacillus satsumensis]
MEEKYNILKNGFEKKADSEKAISMSKYMRNQFDFFGEFLVGICFQV